MKLLMEKLSRYWQLRFLAVGAGVALIVYAVVMPVRRNEADDSSIASVSASQLTPSTKAPVPTTPMLAAAAPSKAVAENLESPWLGENKAAVAQLNMTAKAYEESEIPRDFSESIAALRQAVDRGDAAAEFLLGHAYQRGSGVPKDVKEMERWYARAMEVRVAANAGAPAAAMTFPEALESYRKAADEGDAMAQLYFGLAYDLGDSVPRNAAEAAAWYRKAAAQGSSSAASNLGALYHNGEGVPKDSVEAAVWFARAAGRGGAIAQYSLGRMYLVGDGVPQDNEKAAAWLEKAARQDNAPAEVVLSAMYAAGQGVKGSTAKAYMWINLASASEEQARVSREQLEKVIAPTEVAEGQRMTHDWLAQHSRATR